MGNNKNNKEPKQFVVYVGIKLRLQSSQFGINEIRQVTRSAGSCCVCSGPTAELDKPLEGGWVVLCLNTSSMVITQDQFNDLQNKRINNIKNNENAPIGYVTKLGISIEEADQTLVVTQS